MAAARQFEQPTNAETGSLNFTARGTYIMQQEL